MSTNASKSYLISLLSGSEHGTFGYLAGGGILLKFTYL